MSAVRGRGRGRGGRGRGRGRGAGKDTVDDDDQEEKAIWDNISIPILDKIMREPGTNPHHPAPISERLNDELEEQGHGEYIFNRSIVRERLRNDRYSAPLIYFITY